MRPQWPIAGLILGVVALLLYPSCFEPTEPEVCRWYFSESRSEEEYRRLSKPVQFQVYKCGLRKRPRLVGFADSLADQGRCIIPTLEENIRNKEFDSPPKSQLDFLAVSEVLRMLADGEQIYCDDKVVHYLEAGVSKGIIRLTDNVEDMKVFENLAKTKANCTSRQSN